MRWPGTVRQAALAQGLALLAAGALTAAFHDLGVGQRSLGDLLVWIAGIVVACIGILVAASAGLFPPRPLRTRDRLVLLGFGTFLLAWGASGLVLAGASVPDALHVGGASYGALTILASGAWSARPQASG